MQGPWTGEPEVGLRTLTPVGNLCNIIILQFVNYPLGGMGLHYITSLILLSISLWFLMSLVVYIFWQVLVFFIDGSENRHECAHERR